MAIFKKDIKSKGSEKYSYGGSNLDKIANKYKKATTKLNKNANKKPTKKKLGRRHKPDNY